MKNVPELEGLRGILSMLVVIAHVYPPLVVWVWGSMDVFFCMSGFLIGLVILRGLGKEGFLVTYAWRRITRIWPPYYVTFGLCLLMGAVLTRFAQHPPAWPPSSGNLLSLFFLQNTERLVGWIGGSAKQYSDYLPWMAHTWSVALEEQFYVLAPMLCVVFARLRCLVGGFAVLAVVVLVGGAWSRAHGLSWLTLPARFDAFATGLFTAAVVYRRGQAKALTAAERRLAAGAVLLSSLAIAVFYARSSTLDWNEHFFVTPLGTYGVALFAVLGAGAVVLLASYSGHRSLSALRWSPFLLLGRMSYSTYLAHIPTLAFLGIAMSHWPPLSQGLTVVLELAFCYAAAAVLYLLVERPIMQRRSSALRQPIESLSKKVAVDA